MTIFRRANAAGRSGVPCRLTGGQSCRLTSGQSTVTPLESGSGINNDRPRWYSVPAGGRCYTVRRSDRGCVDWSGTFRRRESAEVHHLPLRWFLACAVVKSMLNALGPQDKNHRRPTALSTADLDGGVSPPPLWPVTLVAKSYVYQTELPARVARRRSAASWCC